MPDLSRQIGAKTARRRYFINRRIQLGLAASLAVLAALAAIGLAGYSYKAAGRRIESVRMRAHVPYSSTREVVAPVILWGVSASFGLVAAVAAVSLVAVLRRAKSISRNFAPLLEAMANGEPDDPAARAIAASPELASAYVEFTRVHDRLAVRARASAEHIGELIAQIRSRPDAASALAGQISKESRRLLDEMNRLQLGPADDGRTGREFQGTESE